MVALSDSAQAKIRRRASRAWSAHDDGTKKRFHRITDVTATTLRYRVKRAGFGRRMGPKVAVGRDDDGNITVLRDYQDPLLDLRSKYDLSKLKSHDGPVRAYKVTGANGQGHVQGGITYEVGKDYEEKHAVTDKTRECAAGINLASLDWAEGELRGYLSARRLFACEFDSTADLAAVPNNTDGKFRVFRCKVIEELEPKAPHKAKTLALPAPKDDDPKDAPEKKGFFDKLLGRGEDKAD